MKVTADLREWEGVYFRSLTGSVSAKITANQEPPIGVVLHKPSGPSTPGKAKTAYVYIVDGSFVAPKLEEYYDRALFLRLPDPKRSKPLTIELDAELQKSDPHGAVWLVKAPDLVGSADISAKLNAEVIGSSSITVVGARGHESWPLKRRLYTLANDLSISLGDSVGISISFDDLQTGSKLSWQQDGRDHLNTEGATQRRTSRGR